MKKVIAIVGPLFCVSVMLFVFMACEEKEETKISVAKVTSVYPLLGTSGTEVLINGENIIKNTTVVFNGIQAEIMHIDDKHITVLVPDYASTGELVVESKIYDGNKIVPHTVTAGIFEVPKAGSVDHNFNTGGIGADYRILKIKTLEDGKIIIAGFLTQYNGISSPLLAKLNADGSIDKNFNAERPSEGLSVNDFDVAPDGSIIIVGRFKYYNREGDPNLFGIARILPDGKHDENMPVGSGPVSSSGQIFSVAVQKDGKILLGGNFTQYRFMTWNSPIITTEAPRQGILRLNEDFSLDESFDPGEGFNGAVTNMIVLDNGDIMVAGAFDMYNGQAANRMALLHSDGTLNTSFSVGQGFEGGEVLQLLRMPTGDWMACGTFTIFRGVNVPGLVRLNSDGSHNSQFTLHFAPFVIGPRNRSVMAVDSNGNLAMSDMRDNIGRRKSLVIVDSHGNLVPFDTGTTFRNKDEGIGGNAPNCLSFDKENHLLVGSEGRFEQNGVQRGGPFRVLTSD